LAIRVLLYLKRCLALVQQGQIIANKGRNWEVNWTLKDESLVAEHGSRARSFKERGRVYQAEAGFVSAASGERETKKKIDMVDLVIARAISVLDASWAETNLDKNWKSASVTGNVVAKNSKEGRVTVR
jgi:hypothetical protein